MLPPRLARTRRSGSLIQVVPLQSHEHDFALQLADNLLRVAQQHQGQSRASWEEAIHPWLQVPVAKKKMVLGICKIFEDRLHFENNGLQESSALRAHLFAYAVGLPWVEKSLWQQVRTQALQDTAHTYNMSVDAVEESLFADRLETQRLMKMEWSSAAEVVAAYEDAHAAAVLLCATHLEVDVFCSSPAMYRFLFRKIKFLQLLTHIHTRGDGYRISISGPFELFQATTKYGLQLALLLPALTLCERVELRAQLRWGPNKQPLHFRWQHNCPLPETLENTIAPEIEALLRQWQKLDTPWQAAPAQDLLLTPDASVVVPDVQFVHTGTGEVVCLEMLGFWSREAVWKRIEWVQQGWNHRMIFAVNKRLRVSEQALPEEAPSSLYVHNGTLLPQAILERLQPGYPQVRRKIVDKP